MALLSGTSWQTAAAASAQTAGLTLSSGHLSASELTTLHDLTQKGEVGRGRIRPPHPISH